MKRAVITGPTGAIGIALIERLIRENVEVIAVVRPDSARKSRIPSSPLVKLVECDLAELSALPEKAGSADVFYHFGWDGTFGNSRNNMHGQNLNVKYALDAVEAAAKMGCEAFIGAGSQAEYGRFEGKLNADVPAFPENGYGIAKLCAGQMTRILCEQHGIRHIWTRILSIYGPFDGAATMVMSTIGKLLKGEHASCTKGEQMWDYLFSEDAALAMYLIGEKGKNGKTYCVGSGQVRPLRDYIEDIKNAAAPDAKIGFGEVAYSDKQVMYLCADISELTEDTGFKPQHTFKEGIEKTVNWCRQNCV
jgi:nucleoside-diphosphate-sugar epimerase